MDDQLILKNRLKVARAEKGLSQTQLAELVGVSRNTISSIETGQFNPTAKLALSSASRWTRSSRNCSILSEKLGVWVSSGADRGKSSCLRRSTILPHP